MKKTKKPMKINNKPNKLIKKIQKKINNNKIVMKL